jgi:hypothetical protein
MRREVKERRRKQDSVRGNDNRIRPRRTPLFRVGCAEALGLRHWEAVRKRELFDRARRGTHASPGRPVGLGDDKRNLVAGIEQALKRPRGELWRAGEN